MDPTPPTTPELSKIDEKKFDAFLKESDHIVGEIRSIQETQRRMISYLPPALAVGLPLLLKPALEVPPELKASIFLGFGFMFLFFVTNYIGLTRGILRLSRYHMEHLAPKINDLIGSTNQELFYWELYVRRNIRRPTKELVGFSLVHGAELILLFSPSIACFALGLYFAAKLNMAMAVVILALVYLVIVGTTAYFALLTVKESRIILPTSHNEF